MQHLVLSFFSLNYEDYKAQSLHMGRTKRETKSLNQSNDCFVILIKKNDNLLYGSTTELVSGLFTQKSLSLLMCWFILIYSV